MGKRRNLNDDLHGDRSDVRGQRKPVRSLADVYFEKYGVLPPEYGGAEPMGTSVVPYSSSKKSSKSHHYSSSCYEKHPPLKIPGTELVVYGGSCSSPAHECDCYIGFEASMRWTARHWPWKKGSEVYFHVPDMGVPKSPGDYKKLVAWAATQLRSGLSLHAGCIGGHGRTGMFLSALVMHMSGEKDAITYVRENYCKKAVESATQVDFLHEHFGIKKVSGSKSYSGSYSGGGALGGWYKGGGTSSKKTQMVCKPLPHSGSIWGG